MYHTRSNQSVLKESESESRSVMSNSLQLHGLYSPWNFPCQNTGAGSHSHLQGIFPAQGSNPGLPHCRRILYQLSYKGSPKISWFHVIWKSLSCVQLSETPWSSPGQNTGVGNLSLLQGIFPNQGSNPGFPHCRLILYQLSHKGSPRKFLGS